jgi:hypothetical protein
MTPVFSITGIHRSLLVWLATGLFLSGCTGAIERLHPQFARYRYGMETMLVLVPEISIYEQLPDGSRLFDQMHSREARHAAQAAIARQLQNRNYAVLPLDTDSMSTGDIQSVLSLFRSVNRSIQLHTIGPQLFPAKKAAFEYHLGTVADILQSYHADGLVLAIGHQTGSVRPTKNWLSIAVVEPEGRIIWYGFQGDHERFNIQNDEGVNTLVASTMANFREQGS